MRFPALLLFPLFVMAQSDNVALSRYLIKDIALNTEADSPLWKDSPAVFAGAGPMNQPAPGYRTQIRSRWSEKYLYFLFICPYETLYLLPNPTTAAETNKLWDHDVAEVFIGGDFNNIWQYRELQVSPQGEWVDLDIDRKQQRPGGGWKWNSGYEVQARIDKEKKTWYGAMKIPIESINGGAAKEGAEYRANFYRIQGPPPDRVFIAWRPTGQSTYHVPEKFGILRLTK
jgi:hypothetical protein